MNTKYIFLDIDGTLVDYEGKMPESTERALTRARANGHKLILCTGRFYEQIYPWLLETVTFDGAITSSGAVVYYGGKAILTKYYTKEQLSWLIEKLRRAGASLCCHYNGYIYSTPDDLANFYRIFDSAGVSSESVRSLLGEVKYGDISSFSAVEKVVYYDASLGLEQMRALVGAEYNIDPFSFKNMPSSCGEVNLAGINKAQGIAALIQHVGGDMIDTIAVGDAGNDITMIRAAGVGVAMGNATDEIKAAADMITTDIGDDGIYNAFCRLSLI